jgi:hypothetical protein
MRALLVVALLAGRLLAQNAGAGVIGGQGLLFNPQTSGDDDHWDAYDYFVYKITRAANGVKTFSFTVYHCVSGGPQYEIGALFPGALLTAGGADGICQALSEPTAETFAPVQEAIGDFLSDASDAPHRIQYGLLTERARPALTGKLSTEPSVTPPNPYAVFLDGFGSNLIKFDLSTLATLGQVAVPDSALGPLAIRPAAAPPANEVWVANGGLQVTVADVGAQKVITNIATPALPVSAVPAGIVFTNSGSTAIEALKFQSADAAGNTGAVAVFNATSRTLTSTLLMKFAPVACVISPDGLTAYLLDNSGRITYYDVLSGTADLSASTYAPGMNTGYPGTGSVFIHPDGTRLFWGVGTFVESFDLTTRKVTAQYSSGLPTTSGTAIEMSPDGAFVSMSNGNGDSVLIDTRYGSVVGTGQEVGAPLVYLGPVR